MIPRATLVAAVLCLVCDDWVTARAQPPDRPGPGGPRRGGFPGGGPGGPGGPFGAAQPVDWAKRRAELIARFDADKDGALSPAEREQMRSVRFREAYDDAKSGRGRGRGEGMFMMPPEVVKKYDKDGDGRLNDEENMSAANGLRAQMEEINKAFDKNANGRLDPEEQDAVIQDIDAGKIEGVPRFFFMMRGPARGPGRGGPPGMGMREAQGVELWKASDADRDGRLSPAELDAARRTQGRGQ